MAITLSGSIVLSSTTSQPKVGLFGDLKSEAAEVVSGSNQPRILELAGTGIIRGINDLDMRHLFEFGRTSGSDATITQGVNTFALTSDFFAVDAVQLINSDGKPVYSLEHMPYQQYDQLIPKQTREGEPQYWTAKNTFDNENIEVYPLPDAKTAADYTLRITYFTRIGEPATDDDLIVAPRELRVALLAYAEYHILFNRKDRRWMKKWAEYIDSAKRCKAAFERVPGESQQWRLDVDTRDTDYHDPLGDY